jgi:NADPH-dependent curcumin reductase CurA
MKNFSREIRLVSRPNGVATHSNFEIAEVELQPLGFGEVRVRNTWMSIDPYMRGRMRDYESYLPPFQIGKVLEGMAVGEVMQSNDPGFATGDTVLSFMGWREVFNAPAAALQKPEIEVSSPQMHLGVCGHPGHTAYIGLADVIKLQPGQVIFISGAAGAVGEIACQIAKLMGAIVIASAGSAEKCAYLKQRGVDKTIDYKKTENLSHVLAELAPGGIDAYFDNVGGDHLDAALASAKNFATFALCGMISGYDKTVSGPSNLMMAIDKRVRLQGFFVLDHLSHRAEFVEKMNGWIRSGDVTYRETVEVGIERAPAAFLKLFTGESVGKMLVKLT